MRFELKNNKRRFKIKTKHGVIDTPIFMPDATYAAITSLGNIDLYNCSVKTIVTTTLHIEQRIGSEYLYEYGGIHKFMGYDKPILTDSGGYQVFSLIHRRNNKENVVTDAGCSFKALEDGKFNFLSPEISQQIQYKIGSDIRLVLDEPMNEDDSLSDIKKAVKRNSLWALRSKKEFLNLHHLTENDFNDPKIARPLLAAIVQGGNNFSLREESAKELIDIGFDIYCFGGIPVHNKKSWKQDAPKGFYHDLITYVASLLPIDKPRYALGVGSPDDIIYACSKGWDLFDCVLPTRNARHAYLYVHKGQGDSSYNNYDVVHIKNSRYQFDKSPLDNKCSCECCSTIDRAYLRYLLKNHNPTGYRYATIHNLTFYMDIIKRCQDSD